MNLQEAEFYGCPKPLLEKLNKAGISNFSTPHDLNNINWSLIAEDMNEIIKRFSSDNLKALKTKIEEKIESRFDILDL
jgi:hypothetical protein